MGSRVQESEPKISSGYFVRECEFERRLRKTLTPDAVRCSGPVDLAARSANPSASPPLRVSTLIYQVQQNV